MWLKSTNIAKIRVTNYLVNKVFVISLGFYYETVKNHQIANMLKRNWKKIKKAMYKTCFFD